MLGEHPPGALARPWSLKLPGGNDGDLWRMSTSWLCRESSSEGPFQVRGTAWAEAMSVGAHSLCEGGERRGDSEVVRLKQALANCSPSGSSRGSISSREPFWISRSLLPEHLQAEFFPRCALGHFLL